VRRARTRRPHAEPDGDHPDRWLVSYADFITLLFAFFVVMYAISQINEGKYRLLSDALLQAFKPESAQQRPPADDARNPRSPVQSPEAQLQNVARDLVNSLGDLIQGGQVRVTESGLGIAVEINASLLFDSASAELAPAAAPTLVALARVLAPLPNDIQVEGHTDNTPIATAQFPSNWELSAARASSVVRLFNANGVASVRLVAVGYADTRNIAVNETVEGRSRNRRVTVLILPEKVRNSASVPPSPASTQPGEAAVSPQPVKETQ
jgi:chemotaxis protein MotB